MITSLTFNKVVPLDIISDTVDSAAAGGYLISRADGEVKILPFDNKGTNADPPVVLTILKGVPLHTRFRRVFQTGGTTLSLADLSVGIVQRGY